MSNHGIDASVREGKPSQRLLSDGIPDRVVLESGFQRARHRRGTRFEIVFRKFSVVCHLDVAVRDLSGAMNCGRLLSREHLQRTTVTIVQPGRSGP